MTIAVLFNLILCKTVWKAIYQNYWTYCPEKVKKKGGWNLTAKYNSFAKPQGEKKNLEIYTSVFLVSSALYNKHSSVVVFWLRHINQKGDITYTQTAIASRHMTPTDAKKSLWPLANQPLVINSACPCNYLLEILVSISISPSL